MTFTRTTIYKLFALVIFSLVTGCVSNHAHREAANLILTPQSDTGAKKPVLHHTIAFQSENSWSPKEKKIIAERAQISFARYITQSECCLITSDKNKANIRLESTIVESPKDAVDYLALGITGLTFGIAPTKTQISYALSVAAYDQNRRIYQNRFKDHINTYIWLPLFFVELANPYSEYRMVEEVLNGFQYRLVKDLADSGIFDSSLQIPTK